MRKWFALFSALVVLLFLLGPVKTERCRETSVEERRILLEKPDLAQLKGIRLTVPKVSFFGGVIVAEHFFPTAFGDRLASRALPYQCTRTVAMTRIVLHLLLFSVILAQFLTILIGSVVFRWTDPTLFFSRDYAALFWKWLFIGTVLGTVVWLLTGLFLRIPDITGWVIRNTNVRSPAQAALPFGFLAFLIPLSYVALHDEQFATIWDRLLFLGEALILIQLLLSTFFNIDAFNLLLSIAAPTLSSDFNPFLPEDAARWMKEFAPTPEER